MDRKQSEYEVYLTREQYTQLHSVLNLPSYTSDKSLIPLRSGVELCCVGDPETCQVYLNQVEVVLIARLLNHIPVHYHLALADALRADGWSIEGRTPAV